MSDPAGASDDALANRACWDPQTDLMKPRLFRPWADQWPSDAIWKARKRA